MHPSLCPSYHSSDKASASYILFHSEGGRVAVLAVGGPLEALEAKLGTVITGTRVRSEWVAAAAAAAAAGACPSVLPGMRGM